MRFPWSRKRPPMRGGGRRRSLGALVGGVGKGVFDTPIDAPVDSAIEVSLDLTRARSRQEVGRGSLASAWLLNVHRHVIGGGLKLRSLYPQGRNADSNPRAEAVEARWKEWGRDCTPDGKSWWEVERDLLSSLVVDGEAYLGIGVGVDGFRVRVIDAGLLATGYNTVLGDGRKVKLGVEYTAGRISGYYLRGEEGGSPTLKGGYAAMSQPVRLDARDVLRCVWTVYANQTRGMPVLTPVLNDMEQLRHYKTSELIAARIASHRAGFIKRDATQGFAAAKRDDDDEDDDAGDADRGEREGEEWYRANFPGGTSSSFNGLDVEVLDPGQEFQAWDIKHPAPAFKDFTSSLTRGVAAGVGVTEHSISGDLSGINFSAGRLGEIGTRQTWKLLRRKLSDGVLLPMFRRWAEYEVLMGRLQGRVEDLAKAEFVGESSPHVQVREEATANQLNLQNRLKSRREIIMADGRDPDTVFAEIEAEEARFGAAGPAKEVPVDEEKGDESTT